MLHQSLFFFISFLLVSSPCPVKDSYKTETLGINSPHSTIVYCCFLFIFSHVTYNYKVNICECVCVIVCVCVSVCVYVCVYVCVCGCVCVILLQISTLQQRLALGKQGENNSCSLPGNVCLCCKECQTFIQSISQRDQWIVTRIDIKLFFLSTLLNAIKLKILTTEQMRHAKIVSQNILSDHCPFQPLNNFVSYLFTGLILLIVYIV